MTLTHGIDHDEHLFNFDSCHESNLSDLTTPTSMPALASSSVDELDLGPTSSYDDSTSQERNERDSSPEAVWAKGKGVTKPLSIPSPVPVAHDHFDLDPSFLMAPSTSSPQNSFIPAPLTPASYHQFNSHSDTILDVTSSEIWDSTDPASKSPQLNADLLWKGKEREAPPVLPPLNFSADFDHDESFWTSHLTASPGPSSYTSTYAHDAASVRSPPGSAEARSQDAEPPISPQSVAPLSPKPLPALRRIPSRPRSLSNLPTRSSDPPATSTVTRIRSKLGSPRISPKLRIGRALEAEDIRSKPMALTAHAILQPWYSGLKVDELDSSIARLSQLRAQDTNPTPVRDFSLKHKGRSKSWPTPHSALDYVPVTSTDLFVPLPLVIRNFFDDVLPRELRLRVLACLVSLHETEYVRVIREGRWCVAKASSSRGKWVGREKGIRELVKFSRVSKSWQTLVFDGQLWTDVGLRSYSTLPESFILRLTAISGSFAKSLDLRGHAQVSPEAFVELSDKLCDKSIMGGLPYTQLTSLNLQGCSLLTARSLHHLLMRSPSLESVCLKGLAAVTTRTCDILSNYCPNLIYLDMTRCSNMDASGIRAMASRALDRGEHLSLKELRVSGLKNIDDFVMRDLGKAAPSLEVLDLSYVRQLHNSAIEAFIACDRKVPADEYLKVVSLSPRELGRDTGDYKLRRRVTRLRHISLSYCPLLSDDACSNLAHSVPDLEFFEMAGIGADLGDEGLVRLLETTPKIRRLDLEDAMEISDDVLDVLSPRGDNVPPGSDPGHALEHLIVSYAVNLSDEALLTLIRGRQRLRHLEMDNTRAGGVVLREFVELSRERKLTDARVVAADLRGVSEQLIKELAPLTRPRMGLRLHAARKLGYLDGRDGNEDELKAAGGQDECDETRVVVKSFYSWQIVDVVKGVREKRRKASSSGSGSGVDDALGRMRWWGPSGRRSGAASPLNAAESSGDGCIVS